MIVINPFQGILEKESDLGRVVSPCSGHSFSLWQHYGRKLQLKTSQSGFVKLADLNNQGKKPLLQFLLFNSFPIKNSNPNAPVPFIIYPFTKARRASTPKKNNTHLTISSLLWDKIMEDDACNTQLVLGVGNGQAPLQYHLLFPPHRNSVDREEEGNRWDAKMADEEDDGERNGSFNERESNTRKKLRLTKEQSDLLEDCFKEHSTLTLRRKQELAEQLNLRPRQVEVWFQNRRARTKLKQTEVDCELLKKCCENLSKENRRLKKELQELRSMKLGSPLLLQLPKVAAKTVNMCPSCERVVAFDQKAMKVEFIAPTIKDASMTCQKLF
ncbi:homeobox-leucine zipper protein HAT22 [Cinnamomum micranthum f. kanehirae]|uniref:Homeobox-leucine zipper protein HAT22 n=1 Tax=Cinnamomum micranthum f. kanehirae TaxID=337451 RepID=A0A3S3NFZ8_9MAGN|nr:homeobox-leucine zipper protein HAT22 [Cinnamomum micranthum f. kanehirae]